MNRRLFFSFIASLPFVGRWVRKEPWPTEVLDCRDEQLAVKSNPCPRCGDGGTMDRLCPACVNGIVLTSFGIAGTSFSGQTFSRFNIKIYPPKDTPWAAR